MLSSMFYHDVNHFYGGFSYQSKNFNIFVICSPFAGSPPPPQKAIGLSVERVFILTLHASINTIKIIKHY
jgi:hypothetical protein